MRMTISRAAPAWVWLILAAGCNESSPPADSGVLDLSTSAVLDLAVPDLASSDLAVPDLAVPDLAAPDLAVPDLLTSNDGASSDGPTSSDGMPDLAQLNTTCPSPTPCGCGPSGVCGTGQPGDSVRCCNYAEDTCNTCSNPCHPQVCAPKPVCCTQLCGTDCTVADCGPDGVHCCDSIGDPMGTLCGSADGLCHYQNGPGFGPAQPLPDKTPCSDGRQCTHATPIPTLVDCASGGNGMGCTRDRPASGAILATDCPASASTCSGTTSGSDPTSLNDGPGNGGPIVGGLCCPGGTSCDLTTGSPTFHKCVGNEGSAPSVNDACLAGVCTYDDSSSCR
jgi:hypothetical protein